MQFYSNIERNYKEILLTEYIDGKKHRITMNYEPYLFIRSHKDTGYKDVYGHNMLRLDFGSMPEAHQYIKSHNFDKFYGHRNFIYPFINDRYMDDFKYNIHSIVVAAIDIETRCDEGFPTPEKAEKEITLITVKKFWQKYSHTFGVGKFVAKNEFQIYHEYSNEREMLLGFLRFWEEMSPDIVTGWNCIPTNQYVWNNNCIKTIEDTFSVYNDSLVKRGPISKKQVYKIMLANGQIIETSGDHKLIIRETSPNKYTNLISNRKSSFKDYIIRTKVAIKNNNCMFVQIPKHTNNNNDVNISDAAIYLSGMIYTDGTMKGKTHTDGYTIYQSDYEMLNKIKNLFGIETKILGPWKNNYSLFIKNSIINKCQDFIYNGNNKRLNVSKLSTLSERQFKLFLSGLLDGDGYKTNHGIAWCNYNNDIYNLNLLCTWNNIFTTISENLVLFPYLRVKDLFLLKNKRWDSLDGNETSLNRKTSSKASQIDYRVDKNCYWVKIKDIECTSNYVDMMDIETKSHTFITNGVKVHNCNGFDIPYIHNRLKNVFGENTAGRLSPWKIVEDREEHVNSAWAGNDIRTIKHIVGVSSLDYMDLYKKFSYTPQPSYKLEDICQSELGTGKTDYSEYGNLENLWKMNYQLYTEYNIQDVDLIPLLEKKLKFIELVIIMAYSAKVNFEDTLKTVPVWDAIIHSFLLKQNIVIPPVEEVTDDRRISGGYVKEPMSGLHKWIVSFDATSLYPSIMMGLNISPETKRDIVDLSVESALKGNYEQYKEYLHENNVSLAANGVTYDRNIRGFLPVLIEKYFNYRKSVKKLMIEKEQELEELKKDHSDKDHTELEAEIAALNARQKAFKILINSIYGAICNEYCRWYDTDVGESVTSTGRFSNIWLNNHVNKKLNSVTNLNIDWAVAGDTDSLYFCLDKLIEKIPEERKYQALNKFCAGKFADFIKSVCVDLEDKFNFYEPRISFKREVISSSAIWSTKKHYAMLVLDSEGVVYETPHLKIMGLDVIKSSMPIACKAPMKKAIRMILEGKNEEIKNLVIDFKSKYKTLPFNEIAFPRSANNIEKWYDEKTLYKSRTPIQVKSSLYYNEWLKRNKLTYEEIKSGNKIKFIYLVLPNPMGCPVIGFPGILPKEMDIYKYIDYETQYEKAFLKPLKSLTDIANIDISTQQKVTSFFK